MSNFYQPPPQQQQQHPGMYGGPGGGVPQQGGPPMGGAFPNFQNVSPEMINFGLHAGQDILNKQKDKWMPGVSGFWLSLKYYFSVSNNYVLNKMLNILYPLNNKQWNRVSADEFERGEAEQVSRKWALPKQDVNAPDLYIPLMAFITYVLMYGLSKGLGSDVFSPDIIIQAIWRCLILQTLESAVVKFGTNMMSVPVPFLDLFSYTGYKYVPLCIITLAKMLNGWLGGLAALYTSFMLAYFILKTVAAVIPPAAVPNDSMRLMILLGVGGMQLLLVLILSWF